MTKWLSRTAFAALILTLFAFPGYKLLWNPIEGAAAQTTYPTGSTIVSPTLNGGYFEFLGPTQNSIVQAHGGTVTCTNGGTPTITNSNLTANSVVEWGLKTASGTPAIPIMTSVTPGTSFTVTCGASDASVWNYLIIG